MSRRESSCFFDSGTAGVPVSLLAFGLPSDPGTFSGYSCNLARALRDRGLLRDEYSIRDLRPWDVLTGAVVTQVSNGRIQPKISRAWIWSRLGNARLARRLHRRLAACGDHGPFLQVGTLLPIPRELGAHFVLTDMTIPQAKRVGCFDVASLSGRALAEALEVQRKVFENARCIFTLSEWTKNSVVADFGVASTRIHVVHAGSNLTIAGDLVEPRNAREILFVGIDWQRKGGELLVEAFRLLRSQLNDVQLTIVGCSPPVNESGVRVEGFLDRRIPADAERLARCYLRAGCFCLPSLFDPFPNAIIEASSVGLPSVAIDNGSRREAILNGVTGRLAARGTAAEVAEALHWILENEERRQRLGQAAQSHAAQNFTWSRVIDRIGNGIVEFTQ